MRRDGITPNRKHAAAVLPSWVGWGGGARRQRVDTAGGPARTQATRTSATVTNIICFTTSHCHWSLRMLLTSHSPVFTSCSSRLPRGPGSLPWHTSTSQATTPTKLSSCTELAVDGRARQRTHHPHHSLLSSAVLIVYACLLCNTIFPAWYLCLPSLSSFSCSPHLYSHLVHISLLCSFFTLLQLTYFFAVSCSDYKARVLAHQLWFVLQYGGRV